MTPRVNFQSQWVALQMECIVGVVNMLLICVPLTGVTVQMERDTLHVRGSLVRVKGATIAMTVHLADVIRKVVTLSTRSAIIKNRTESLVVKTVIVCQGVVQVTSPVNANLLLDLVRDARTTKIA